MYRIIIIPAALKDIKDAALWYNTRWVGLGKKFTTEVRVSIAILKKDPIIYAVRYDEVRTFLTEVFPYLIHYIVNESNKEIVITAVLHTSRAPEIWQRKT